MEQSESINYVMVSIIIPIYNTELYLDECIQSVLNQTYPYWELILIDDGSTDHSKEICLKYQKKDSRISYIYQYNQGVSHARNQGLKIARGKYVYFMDSDDIAEALLLEKAVSHIKNTDMVYFNIVSFSDNKKDYEYSNVYEKLVDLDGSKNRLEFILNRYLNYELCYFLGNKLFNLQIIQENNIFFNKGVFIGEDLGFSLTFLLYAKNIKGISDVLYKYRIRKGSAMDTLGKLQIRINDFSLMLENIQFHAIKRGITRKDFNLIFIKTMDNQYSKRTYRREFKPYVLIVQNQKFLIAQTLSALMHPWRFLYLFGNPEAKRKWKDHLYIIWYLLSS